MLAGWPATRVVGVAGVLVFCKAPQTKVWRLWPGAAVHSAVARDQNPNYFLPTSNKRILAAVEVAGFREYEVSRSSAPVGLSSSVA